MENLCEIAVYAFKPERLAAWTHLYGLLNLCCSPKFSVETYGSCKSPSLPPSCCYIAGVPGMKQRGLVRSAVMQRSACLASPFFIGVEMNLDRGPSASLALLFRQRGARLATPNLQL